MSIWFKERSLADALAHYPDTMAGHLGIEITRIESSAIEGRMPVEPRTTNGLGYLHGGASVALAESLGGLASNLIVDPDRHYCVALDVNATHLRSVATGHVLARATPVRIGRRSHVWQIDINDSNRTPVCSARMTVSVIKRRDDAE